MSLQPQRQQEILQTLFTFTIMCDGKLQFKREEYFSTIIINIKPHELDFYFNFIN